MKENEETNEPKEIKVENISFEIIGEDENEEEQKSSPSIWAGIALLSFIAMVISLFISGVALIISTVVFSFSISMAVFFGHNGITGDDNTIYCQSDIFHTNSDDN